MNYFASLKIHFKKEPGFTFVEVLVYIVILSLVLLLISSIIFYFMQSNNQSKGDREAVENARRAMEIMAYEISGAKSVYTPTTTASQLSLETSRYLPSGEATTYIDFFVCGTRLCLKKESQNPIFLTADSVVINSVAFNRIVTNGLNSVKITLSLSYKTPPSGLSESTTTTTTVSLRSY